MNLCDIYASESCCYYCPAEQYMSLPKATGASDKAKDKRLETRTELIKADKWDEVRAFDEKEKAEHPFPFTKGAMKALQAYRNTTQRGCDSFEVDDLP